MAIVIGLPAKSNFSLSFRLTKICKTCLKGLLMILARFAVEVVFSVVKA
jgi:hypothetical protein